MCAYLVPPSAKAFGHGVEETWAGSMAAWGCDDVNEGTLHNGFGDARVNGLAGSVQTDEETDNCIALLESARRKGREQTREAAAADAPEAVVPPAAAVNDNTPLPTIFDPLSAFTLRNANDGGPELKLYDAMTSPDRQLLKAGYFVAEGALVVQQLLRMPEYRMVSMLSTEAQAPASSCSPHASHMDMAPPHTCAP